jgi:uncharacterized delta-60 repeat protein
VAVSTRQTSDGGYIVTGWTESFGAGNADLWVLKLNSSGNVQWQKTYGDVDGEGAESIQQTSDGGYIVAGETASFGIGEVDLWVLKLDSSGNVQWERSYGGGGDNEDSASSIQQTRDGGYIVAGEIQSFGAGGEDIWILKLDSSGNVQWERSYGGGGDNEDSASSIQQTRDGGYIVAGPTESFGAGDEDLWVLKLNSSGNVQWQKAYGEVDGEGAEYIQQTSDGGYIVTGWTASFGSGGEDFWVLKLASNGNVQWQKTYGGGNDDEAMSIQQIADGDYIVAGWTESFGAGDADLWVLKLDSNGNVQWQKTYGGSGYDGGSVKDYVEAVSIQQTCEGGYIVTVPTESFGAGGEDLWVLKLKPDGTIDPSCNFIADTSVSGVNSNATVTNTNAVVTNTTVTPQTSDAEVDDTDVSPDFQCQGDVEDCTDTTYSRGVSFIKFNYKKPSKDKASLRICVDECFCNALKGNPEKIVVALDDCHEIEIPGSMLKSNKSKTKFRAKSSTYSLIIDCKNGWLSLRLKNVDLNENCISNPVKFCVSIEGSSSCLCVEEEFEEKRDKQGRLKKLLLRVTEACSP